MIQRTTTKKWRNRKMPIDSQVEVKQVRLVKGTGAQIAAARQASEILETDLVVQTDAPDLVQANTAITGATKCKITYDSKGLVTAGSDLNASDITTALGYTPYNSSNPSGYITGITSAMVTTALGYTPYNSTNPSGYQANVIETVKVNGTSLTPSSKAVDITVPTNNNQLTNGAGYITSSALNGYATQTWVGQQGYLTSTSLNGYATEQWVGQQGYLTGITSSDVTTALGYTPYNSSNPNGYTSNIGTVTSVNNVSPVNGNVTLSIPSEVTETTVSNWGFTKNVGTVTSVNNVSPVNGNVSLTIPDTSNLADKDLSNLSNTGKTKLDWYGTSSTGASTQEKVVSCTGFVLTEGVSIRVKFTNSQSYNGNPTLNVNGTGALSVKAYGTTNAGRYYWRAGEVVSFTYDGTNWIIEDGVTATTSYFGVTALTSSATSTSESRAATPYSISNLVQNMIEPYPVYSATSTYAVGDKVRYSYNAWVCNTAITGGGEAWNADHWTKINDIQTQIDNINLEIGDVETLINAL